MDERQGEYLDDLSALCDTCLGLSPVERREVISEVRAGERCRHGYPDQGEGCPICDIA